MNYFDILKDPWNENIVLSSVPMWKYKDGVPVANASGCLVDYSNSRFILSVAHSTIAISEWNFEVSSAAKNPNNDEWETVIQPVNMQFLTQFELIPNTDNFTEPKIVDFTYRKVPNLQLSEHVIEVSNDFKKISALRTVFNIDKTIHPTTEMKYGFFGYTKFSGVEGRKILFEPRLENNLSYVGEKDDYYIFKLPKKYGGHNKYKGCSGAPVIDSNNNLLGLVAFGDRKENSIYSIKIEKYLAALKIEADPNL